MSLLLINQGAARRTAPWRANPCSVGTSDAKMHARATSYPLGPTVFTLSTWKNRKVNFNSYDPELALISFPSPLMRSFHRA
jgi:hypothetical protein